MKRRDPWHGVNVLPKAEADPELSGEDAQASHRRVFTWFANRWRNHQLKQAEKPHSITRRFWKTECRAALLRGRRLRLPWRIASGSWQPRKRGAKCQHGKESMASSHPPFSPCQTERSGRDFMFLPWMSRLRWDWFPGSTGRVCEKVNVNPEQVGQ